MTPDVTDEHLVTQAQAGHREAFLTLYNRYLNKVYNRVKSRIPPQDAEDVTQEIFLAVVRSLDNFEGRSKFNTWLYTIVNRQIADYYRRLYRKNDKQTISLDDYEGPSPSIEDHRLDDKIVIRQALHRLPEHYQEVILLRFADGLTFGEIGHKIGKSLEATKSLYRRAIQAISDEIE